MSLYSTVAQPSMTRRSEGQLTLDESKPTDGSAEKIKTRQYYMLYPMSSFPMNGMQMFPGTGNQMSFTGMQGYPRYPPTTMNPSYPSNQYFPGMMGGGPFQSQSVQPGGSFQQSGGSFQQPGNSFQQPGGSFQQPLSQPTSQPPSMQGNQFQVPQQPPRNGNYGRQRPKNNNMNVVMVNPQMLPNGQPKYNPLDDPSFSEFL